jgi:hypothetical protein
MKWKFNHVMYLFTNGVVRDPNSLKSSPEYARAAFWAKHGTPHPILLFLTFAVLSAGMLCFFTRRGRGSCLISMSALFFWLSSLALCNAQQPDYRTGDVFRNLDIAQTQLVGKVFTGNAIRVREHRPREGGAQHLTTSNVFDVKIYFDTWGFAATRSVNTQKLSFSAPPTVVESYALRSNTLVVNWDKVGVLGPNGRPFYASEMAVQNTSSAHFLPKALIPLEFKSFLQTMRGLKISATTNNFLLLEGELETASGPERWVFTCAPDQSMFPVHASAFRDNVRYYEWNASFAQTPRNSYFPETLSETVYAVDSRIILQTVYTNLTVNLDHNSNSLPLLAGKGTVVNETRYKRSFAYVVGERFPTTEELGAMAESDEAILRYQQDSSLTTPLTTHEGHPGRRWIVFGALAALTVALLAFVIKFRKRDSGPA